MKKFFFLVLIIISVCAMTIGYSALNSELTISGEAMVRADADIRINGLFYYDNANGGAETFNSKYTVNSLTLFTNLPNDDSSVTFKVDIKNSTLNDYGILEINGLNENLDYEITNYNLKDRLCTNSECNNGNADEIYLIIKYKDGGFDGLNTDFSSMLDFTFKLIYPIYYVGFDGTGYPNRVMDGDDLTIKFAPSIDNIVVKMDGVSLVDGTDYIYLNNEFRLLREVNGTISIEKVEKIVYLNQANIGSYVLYSGNNGCVGTACNGDNANGGYCGNSANLFTSSGFRVAYIRDGYTYLVSAGAPECISTKFVENSPTTTSINFNNAKYYFGTGYTLNDQGQFSLTGVSTATLDWKKQYNNIINSTPYTCLSTSSTGTCTTLYRVTSRTSNKAGQGYAYTVSSNASDLIEPHIASLNTSALKYCNPDFVSGGVCNANNAWAMNPTDFNYITGKVLSSSSCFNDATCSQGNDLIDNDGYYWLSEINQNNIFGFNPDNHYMSAFLTTNEYGVRPIIKIDSNVLVTDGTGSKVNPYTISK